MKVEKGIVMKSKKIKPILILAIAIFICHFMFRIPAEVKVYQFLQYSEVDPNSIRIIKNKAQVRHFTYAARFAKKQRGVVDMLPPDYKFILGDKQYDLWLDDQSSQGILMKLPNSSNIYKISRYRSSKLLEILEAESSTQ